MLKMKEKLSSVTCILAFIIGFGLTIAGFCVPPLGEISGSVLWVLGQSLLYCGAILGISTHYDNKLKDIESTINARLNQNAN